jgi:hypothetical protein
MQWERFLTAEPLRRVRRSLRTETLWKEKSFVIGEWRFVIFADSLAFAWANSK